MTIRMIVEAQLVIRLLRPVKGLAYGLQKGKAADHTIEQVQLGKDDDLVFRFSVQLKRSGDKPLNLGGPYVQGPAGKRFVYISIGSYAGQGGTSLNGRIKVPLPEADFAELTDQGKDAVFTCQVPGSTKDGKPVYATVKPFDGWRRM